MKAQKIVAIGSTVLDAFWGTDFQYIASKKTPSGKALAIPFGEKFKAKDLTVTLGGNAANAAVTFARQNILTRLYTRIGDDTAGMRVISDLKKEGIECKDVAISKREQTAQSILLLQDGERSAITYHGAMDKFSVRDIPKEKAAHWWYVSLPGESWRALPTILKIAKKQNIKIALNPSYGHLFGVGKKQLLTHLKMIDFLVLNDSEAAKITGVSFKEEKKLFKKLDDLMPGIVAVTMGKKGVKVSDGTHLYTAGIFKEKKLVDRTGAGDAFGSGFVAGLIHKKENCKKGICSSNSLVYAIRLASANATSVVEHIGATMGILTKRQFETEKRWQHLTIKITNHK